MIPLSVDTFFTYLLMIGERQSTLPMDNYVV